MSVKTVRDAHSLRTIAFGRNRPVALGPRLFLRNYLPSLIPPPPTLCNYRGPAFKALIQMYLNDLLGNCVIAAMAHIAGVFAGNAGRAQLIFTKAQIIALYSAIGGYVPGNPATDNGCDEITALNYWENNGAPIGQNKIAGTLVVDATNPVEYRTALWLFENLFFGVELPDKWISPFPSASNFRWDIAGPPNPSNGHAYNGCGYSPDGIVIDTWGMAGLMTDKAVQYYAYGSEGGALYSVLSMECINRARAKAPNGLDFAQLTADFIAMGGTNLVQL